MTHHVALAVTLLFSATSVAVGQASGSSRSQFLGRWRLVGAMNPAQSVRSVEWIMVLNITSARLDSLFGRFVVAPDPRSAPHDTVSAPLSGALAHGRLRFLAPTQDEPDLDNVIEGVVRSDTLFVDQYRPRAGPSVVPPGYYLLFLRDHAK